MGSIVVYLCVVLGSLGGYFYLRKKKKWGKYRNYLPVLAALGALCLLTAVVEQLGGDGEIGLTRLRRNQAGAGSLEVPLLLEPEDVSGATAYSVTVEEQRLTEEEAAAAFVEAGGELERMILGENVSPEEISSDLKIPATLLEGLVEVECVFQPYDLVERDGSIRWENFSEEAPMVLVTAELSCQEWEASHSFYLRLVPKAVEGGEALIQKIQQYLEAENEKSGQEYLLLPEEIDGVGLKWYSPAENLHAKVLLLGLGVMVAYYVCQKEKGERERKEWERRLNLDYPDIVSQLSLLFGAGMPVAAAWAKLATEYRDRRAQGRIEVRPGYEELLKTFYEIQDGTGERAAYENFGRRCNQPRYRKFAALLTQNVRKGTKDMQQLLDMEAAEAFLQRKSDARKLGEEAGTKLLLPMGLMLLLVFAVLMLPAMLSLGV